MTSVLVVDDQMLIRAGLTALLRAAPGFDVAGEAADGQEAVDRARELRPDVVLMDLRLPEVSGVTATERILAERPEARVLALTTFDLDEYVYAALRAGASGFLLKETPADQLLAAVRVVAGGEVLYGPTVVRRLVETYTRAGAACEAKELTLLTARETQVLRLVGRGRDNAGIAGELVVSEATVKTHLHRVMTKLGLSSRAQAVVVAYETGLVTPRRLDGPRPPD
ncbi:response regulator transcription factor [Nucisporomicrobium flavum]|uniref:response regulator transcription factor n=1 Tax=Nucisporomicrobium flavum TaxID=2785915 RepID=UPI003C2E3085